MTKNDRDRQFEETHKRVWGSIKTSGLPLEYRQEVNRLQRQATLIVLTTMEDIELLRAKAGREKNFDPDEQLVNFCISMYDAGAAPGGTVICKVAIDGFLDNLNDQERLDIEVIRESINKSQMKKEEVDGPIDTPWKA